jgi:hypothetical protein
MILTRPEQLRLRDYGEAQIDASRYEGEWEMTDHGHEPNRLTILGGSETDRDKWPWRPEKHFLVGTRREMQLLSHGEDFRDDIGTIQGRMQMLSPGRSLNKIEKESCSAFLLECSSIILKKIQSS